MCEAFNVGSCISSGFSPCALTTAHVKRTRTRDAHSFFIPDLHEVSKRVCCSARSMVSHPDPGLSEQGLKARYSKEIASSNRFAVLLPGSPPPLLQKYL